MKLVRWALLTLLLGGVGNMVATAAELPDGPHIATTGSAKIEVAPDMAILTISVNKSDNSAAQAKKQVDERIVQYVSFLNQRGIDKKEINSANLNTYPEYERDKNGKVVATKYRAQRTIEVKVYQLDGLNELLDGALQAGLTDIGQIGFKLKDPEHYQSEARKKAVADAIAKAQALAQDFGVTLGKAYSIRYQSTHSSVPVLRMGAMAVPAADSFAKEVSESYAPQAITITDQVDVVFDIQR